MKENGRVDKIFSDNNERYKYLTDKVLWKFQRKLIKINSFEKVKTIQNHLFIEKILL